MCGIVGFTGQKDGKKLQSLLEQIQHRGRDETITRYQSGINFGMNRLAIKDLSKKIFPFKYQQYYLIYNGEIYNHLKLRRLLTQKHQVIFKTQSDAEVILPLFAHYGVKSFAMLEGMFALTIIDQQKKEIILARDKSGEKPLYYLHQESQFAFSSELKNLMTFSEHAHQISRPELEKYLREGSIFGRHTLIERIDKIQPAHYGIYQQKNSTFKTSKYWQPEIRSLKLSEKKAVKKLDKLLTSAVTSRLMSDVPVGGFLSGGVDSSLISAIAKQHLTQFHTFSISFPGHHHEDESKFANLAAQHLGTNHQEIECRADEIRPIIEQLGEIIDEPIVDPAVLPTYLMTQAAREKVKVVLSGEGADELFGGYHRYQKFLIGSSLTRFFPGGLFSFWSSILPSRISYKINKALTPLNEIYSSQNVWTISELDQLLINSQYQSTKIPLPNKMFSENPLLAMQMHDFYHYLGEQLLMKVDKFSMIHNLETRAPYLDTKLINFAFSLPHRYKIRGWQSKYLLRQVAKRYLPHKISHRFKHGFSVPLDEWFRFELRDVMEDSIVHLSSLEHIFNAKYLRHILDEQLAGYQHRDKIWSLVVLSKWIEANKLTIQT